MELNDTQFELKTVLIYNPTLKPENRKALQGQIQQTKILYYYPLASEPQEKCNHVGLAQGLYSFFGALSLQQTEGPRQQVTYTSHDVFIIKEVEPDIWLFVGLAKVASYNYVKCSEEYVTKEIHSYSYETLTEDICFNFVDHFYMSFVTFQGGLAPQLALKERLPEFSRTMTEFIGRYVLLNENQSTKKMDLNYYLFGGVRLTPLDPNYMLKFNYFQSIMQTFDPSCRQLLIYYGGYLVFSTLPADMGFFMYNYYYGYGEPFKFDDTKIKKKFTNMQAHKLLAKVKYGYFVNSLSYGGVESKKEAKKDGKQPPNPRQSMAMSKQFDLLGLEDTSEVGLMEVHIKLDGKLVPMGLNTFLHGKLLMLSLSTNTSRSLQRIQLQNRFFMDNVQRFAEKLTSIVAPLSSQVAISLIQQQQFHRFIYVNTVNMGGKMTLQIGENQQVGVAMRNIFSKLKSSEQDLILSTTGSFWVYGMRRLNRLLVVVMSNEIPLHKIEEYMDRLAKDYFPAIYI